jgi:prophage DNA circulation protein
VRRWLAAFTLVGLVLAGVAMMTHVSSSAHPVDAVLASTSALSDRSAAMPSHGDVGTLNLATCADCAVELGSSDHAMLLGLACAFVAMISVALFAFVRSGRLLWMLKTQARVVTRELLLAGGLLPRPNLVALGISRR